MRSPDDAQIVIDPKITRMTKRRRSTAGAAERESAGYRHQQVLRNIAECLDADIGGTKVLRARFKVADAVSINAERIHNRWADEIGVAECQRLRGDISSFGS